jgi:hypothetical protein
MVEIKLLFLHALTSILVNSLNSKKVLLWKKCSIPIVYLKADRILDGTSEIILWVSP